MFLLYRQAADWLRYIMCFAISFIELFSYCFVQLEESHTIFLHSSVCQLFQRFMTFTRHRLEICLTSLLIDSKNTCFFFKLFNWHGIILLHVLHTLANRHGLKNTNLSCFVTPDNGLCLLMIFQRLHLFDIIL